MRKIEFKPSVNGLTKIFVDGKELQTQLDPKALRQFRANKSKLPPVMEQQILNAMITKLKNDVVTLTTDELKFIAAYLKEQT
jgi:hypothetical protein